MSVCSSQRVSELFLHSEEMAEAGEVAYLTSQQRGQSARYPMAQVCHVALLVRIPAASFMDCLSAGLSGLLSLIAKCVRAPLVWCEPCLPGT